MKKKLLTLAGAAAITLGLGACAYDPYYSGNTRTAVSASYGYGHGYGGSSFSTSFFWSTGDSRWGYDPYVRSYYDFHRRAYYDPYLYGYYPIGYRPPILIGVPHPYGYRHGWCPPPRRVTNVTVVNYRDRESAYRRTNHSWAQNVRYDRNHRTSATRTDGRAASHSGAAATTTRNPGSRQNFDNRNRGQGRGATAAPQQRTSVDPRGNMQQRNTPTRQPANASPRPGGRESFGSRPEATRRPITPPQGPSAAQREARMPNPGAANRGGQPSQRAAAPPARGRENAGVPPNRGGAREAPPTRSAQPGPPANRAAGRGESRGRSDEADGGRSGRGR